MCLDSSIGLKSQLGCLEYRKNLSFYTIFGCNRPIKAIDGYDETSTMDRFRKYRGRQIMDGASRCDRRDAL